MASGAGRARPARAPFLPEGPPDRDQLDAEPPGGTAAGEEQAPAARQGFRRRRAQSAAGCDGARPAVEGVDDVLVDVEQHVEAGGGVGPRDVAERRGPRVRRLGQQGPEPELRGVAQEGLGRGGRPVRGCWHRGLPLHQRHGDRRGILLRVVHLRCAPPRPWPRRSCCPPVFRLRSKRGKLLLLTSMRIRWPASKKLLVVSGCSVTLYTLPGFHPRQRLVVALAVPEALDRLVQVVRAAVGVDVEHLDGDVGVLHVGRDVRSSA